MPGMIVAPEALPVEAGAEVLRRGGNAFDAAVTTALAQGVVDPHDSSIGGYVLLTMHRPADGPGSVTVLDAPVTAGEKSGPDMWVDRYIGPNPDGWGFWLRGKVNEITDWRGQIEAHREQLIKGAAVAGFVVGGLLAVRALRRR